MRFRRRSQRSLLLAIVGLLTVTGVTETWGADTAKPGRRQQRWITNLQSKPKLALQITTPFNNPPESKAINGVHHLTLGVHRFDQTQADHVDKTIPKQFDLLCYNGSPVGPTIRVRRGTTLKIDLKNNLDPNPDMMPAEGDLFENIHGLSYTNLHTHGLHVSPIGNADDITKEYGPGQSHRFEYEILPRHAIGTFWYHPHKHGSVAYQLSNGVAGALIVEGVGDPNDDIPELEDVAEIRNAKEQILVLQWYTYGTYAQENGDTIGFIDARNTRTYNANPNPDMAGVPEIQKKITHLPPTCSEAPDALMAINGQINPCFEIQPGEVQRWRVIHAGWDVQQAFHWLEVDGITPAKALNFYEIALDGLATGRMTESPILQIAPGQRSDVLIKAPTLEAGQAKTYLLVRSDTSNPPLVGTTGTVNPVVLVAKLNVRGPAKPMNLPSDKAALARCRELTSIPDSEIVASTLLNSDETSTTDTLLFHGNDPNNTDPVTNDTTAKYTLNGKTFHRWVKPIPLTLGTAQQWTLKADAMDHPFHIHVNPFHVISYTDAKGQVIPMDVWRDTLFIPEGTSYTIRHKFQDWPGLSVIHCHILDHEDQGMMMPILFIDPKAAKPAVGGALLTPMNRPAPSVALADMAGASYRLAESRGQKVVLVFFKGIQCAHCSDDLKTILKDARAQAGAEAQIIAVSARKIPDPAAASRMLGVVAGDKFRLLVDESHATFKAYGCVSGDEPQHGLFLIDTAGVIRSGYVGETPFGDSAGVFDGLRRIASVGPKPPG
jgi:FtsP/CotA-like multicopper oxidase with cupredoxin domain/peroxiredoxin